MYSNFYLIKCIFEKTLPTLENIYSENLIIFIRLIEVNKDLQNKGSAEDWISLIQPKVEGSYSKSSKPSAFIFIWQIILHMNYIYYLYLIAG